MEFDNPIRILHREAGSPLVPGVSEQLFQFSCRLCGLPARHGIPLQKFVGNSTQAFTDWKGHGTNTMVCAACAWGRGGKPAPTVTMGEGAIPYPLRTYTHAWSEKTGWRFWTRRFVKDMSETLKEFCKGDSPWFMACTESSKKNTVTLATLNPGGDGPKSVVIEDEVAQFEVEDGVWRLQEDVELAYRAGISKNAILTGEPSTKLFETMTRKEWKEWEKKIAPSRGSAALVLAAYLATKEDGPKEEEKDE